MNTSPITIVIAEDHALVRKGLVALLQGREDFNVIGEAADGLEAVRLAEELDPDVMLMDLEMPRLDGVTATERIKAAQKDCKILVITSFEDDARVLAAMEAGANGYLLKTMMPERLVMAIDDVCSGGTPLDPAITDVILRRTSNRAPAEEPGHHVTEREATVLGLLARGYSDRQIAQELGISVRTASTHVYSILQKLQLRNRTQAALYAIRNGYANFDGSGGDEDT